MLFCMLIHIVCKDESIHHFGFHFFFVSTLEINSYFSPHQELRIRQNVLPYVSQGPFLCVDLSYSQAWSIP